MSMRGLTIAGFVVLGLAAAVLYATGRARRAGLAPLGELVDNLAARRVPRLALVAVWAWTGWHFLAR